VTGLRALLLLVAPLLLAAGLAPGRAAAAPCGGGVPCGCGDSVAADHRLTVDLGPCPGHGLTVQSGVRLDCDGRRIIGMGNGSQQYGVRLDGRPGRPVTGVTVRGCHVSRFLRGIRLREARGNTIAGNVLTRNGDPEARKGYGIDLATGSIENLLQGNRVSDSADEGVHIGRGSHGNRLLDNEITDSGREGLYVLAADRGVFLRNTIGGTGTNSLYVKDSSGNRFEGNRFVGRPVRVTGDARDNVFADNAFSGAGLHFQDYRGAGRPRGNRVIGGTLAGKEYCVRFTNSDGNAVMGAALTGCAALVIAESPAGRTENMVLGVPDGPAVRLDDRSTVRLGWPMRVRVRDAAGAPVAGATVLAREGAAPAWTAVTGADGATAPQAVTTSRTGGSPARSLGSVAVAVTKPGFRRHDQEVSLTGPVELAVTLERE
jgi:parallel beta-helix repeat protein